MSLSICLPTGKCLEASSRFSLFLKSGINFSESPSVEGIQTAQCYSGEDKLVVVCISMSCYFRVERPLVKFSHTGVNFISTVDEGGNNCHGP